MLRNALFSFKSFCISFAVTKMVIYILLALQKSNQKQEKPRIDMYTNQPNSPWNNQWLYIEYFQKRSQKLSLVLLWILTSCPVLVWVLIIFSNASVRCDYQLQLFNCLSFFSLIFFFNITLLECTQYDLFNFPFSGIPFGPILNPR